MIKRSFLLTLLFLVGTSLVFAQANSLDQIIKKLQSEDKNQQKEALKELENRGPAGKRALPAVREIAKEGDEELVPLVQKAVRQMKPGDVMEAFLPLLTSEAISYQKRGARALSVIEKEAYQWLAQELAETKEKKKTIQLLKATANFGSGLSREKDFPRQGKELNLLIDQLVRHLPSPSQKVTRASQSALAQFSSPAIETVIRLVPSASPTLRSRLINVLVAMGREPFPTLKKLLVEGEAKKRVFAVRTLHQMGYRARLAREELGKALKDSEIEVRRYASLTLARLGKEALPVLYKALDSESQRARIEALAILQAMGEKGSPARQKVTNLLKGSEPVEIQTGAVKALGAMRGQAVEALPQLVKFYGSSPPALRGTVLNAIKKIGPPRGKAQVVEELKKFFTSSQLEVRNLAARIVGSLGQGALPELLPFVTSSEESLRQVGFEGLAAAGKAAVPTLINLLQSKDQKQQRNAIETLAKIGEKARGALPSLIRAYPGAPNQVQSQLKSMIEGLLPAREEELEELVGLLKSKEPQVRAMAQKSILSISNITRDQGENLLPLLESSQKEIRNFAQKRLTSLALNSPHLLIDLLKGKGKKGRKELLKMVEKKGRSAYEILIDKVISSPQGDPGLFQAMGELGRKIEPLVLEALFAHPQKASRLAPGIGQMGPAGVEPALALFFTPPLQKDGEKALAAIGEPAVLPLTHLLLQGKRVLWIKLLASGSALGQPGGGKMSVALSKSQIPSHREIVEVLVAIGDPAVPSLIHLLGTSGKKKDLAHKALIKIGKPAIPHLVQTFALTPHFPLSQREKRRKEEAFLRQVKDGVVKTLVAIGEPAIPALIDSFSERDSAIRGYASIVLSSMGTKTIPYLKKGLESKNPNVKSFSTKVLGDLGIFAKGVVGSLVKNLKSSNLQVRNSASEALVKVGKASVDPVLELFKSTSNKAIKKETIEILGKLGQRSKAAVPHLVKDLKSAPDESTRIAIVTALGRIGKGAEKAGPVLVKLLPQAQTEELTIAILDALGEMGAKSAIPQIVPYRVSSQFYVRKAAAESLTSLGTPTNSEIPGLIELLRHKNPFIRQFAGNLLVKVGREAVEPLVSLLGEEKAGEEAVKVLAKLGDQAFSSLLFTAKDKNLPVTIRKRAIQAIGLSRSSRPIPRLISLYPRLEKPLQKEVEVALRRLKTPHPSNTYLLSRLIHHRHPWVRKTAARELGKIKEPRREGQKAMIKALKESKEPEVVKEVEKALSQMGKKTLQTLLSELATEKKEYRQRLVEVLAKMGQKGHKPLLKALEDKRRRQGAARALAALGKEALPPLLEALGKEKSQKGAALALSQMGKVALPALEKALGDKKRRQGAAWALSWMGKDALPLLEKVALSSKEEKLKIMATQALLDMGGPGEKSLISMMEKGREEFFQVARLLRKNPSQYSSLLLKSLKSSDSRVRFEALNLLAQNPKSLPILTKALLNDELQDAARDAIKKMGPKGVKWLRKALSSKNAERRLSAAAALNQIGRPARSAVPELVEALGDSNREVAQMAGRALSQMGEEALKPLEKAYEDHPSQRELILETLGRIRSPQSLPLFKKALDSSLEKVRLEAVKALSRLSKETDRVLPLLVKALEDKKTSVRLAAVQGIARFGKKGRQAAPALLKSLADTSYDVAQAASRALMKVGLPSSKALPKIVELLGHSEVEVRKNAIRILVKSGQKCLPHLKKTLQKGSTQSRLSALEILSKMPPQKAFLPLLVQQFSSANSSLRQVAYRQVARFGKGALPELKSALKSEKSLVRETAIRSLGLIGEKAGPAASALVNRLEDGNDYQNFLIAQTLAEIGPAALKEVSKALFNSSYKVRLLAVQTVNKMGEKGAPIYRDLLKVLRREREAEIRSLAVEVLGKIASKKPQVIPALIRARGDSSRQVSGQAKTVLEKIKTLPAHLANSLAALLVGDDKKVKRTACEFLAKIGPPAQTSVPNLISLLGDPSAEVRRAAARALSQIGLDKKERVSLLVNNLSETDLQITRPLLRALTKSDFTLSPATLSEVSRFLDSPSIQTRISAVTTFGQGGEKALPYLREALKDREIEVKLAALKALGEVGEKGISTLLTYTSSENHRLENQAVLSLTRVGKKAIPHLVTYLDSPRPLIRQEVKGLLLKYDREALPVLEKYLKENQKKESLKEGIEILAEMGQPAVPLLVKTLKWSPQVRKLLSKELTTKFSLLEKIKKKEEEVEKLQKTLSQEDLATLEKEQLQRELAREKKKWKELKKKAKEANLNAEYLEELSHQLLGLLVSDDDSLAQGAQKILSLVGEASIPSLLKACKKWPPYLKKYLFTLPKGKKVVIEKKKASSDVQKKISPALRQAFENFQVFLSSSVQIKMEEKNRKWKVVDGGDEWLVRKEKDVFKIYQVKYQNPDGDFLLKRDRLRRRAIAELAQRGEEVLPHLYRALKKEDSLLRKACLMTLVQRNSVPDSSLRHLVKVLNDPHEEVRYYAGEVLQKLGRKAVGPLLGALGHSQTRVQAAAARALGKIGEEARSAMPELIGKLDDNKEVALAASQALSQIGSPPPKHAQKLVEALKSPHKEVKKYALQALYSMADDVPQAASALAQALTYKDGEIRSMAALALVKIGKPAVKSVEPLLSHSKLEVRRQAVFVLGRMGGEAKGAVPSLAKLLKDQSSQMRELVQRSLEAITGKYFESPQKWNEWASQLAPAKKEKKEKEKKKPKKKSHIFVPGKKGGN